MDPEINTVNTAPLGIDPRVKQEEEFLMKLGGAENFHAEISKAEMKEGRDGDTILRFTLTWYFWNPTWGVLGDASDGCLAWRNEEGIDWGNHKMTFAGGSFTRAVHTPTEGWYKLVKFMLERDYGSLITWRPKEKGTVVKPRKRREKHPFVRVSVLDPTLPEKSEMGDLKVAPVGA